MYPKEYRRRIQNIFSKLSKTIMPQPVWTANKVFISKKTCCTSILLTVGLQWKIFKAVELHSIYWKQIQITVIPCFGFDFVKKKRDAETEPQCRTNSMLLREPLQTLGEHSNSSAERPQASAMSTVSPSAQH